MVWHLHASTRKTINAWDKETENIYIEGNGRGQRRPILT